MTSPLFTVNSWLDVRLAKHGWCPAQILRVVTRQCNPPSLLLQVHLGTHHVTYTWQFPQVVCTCETFDCTCSGTVAAAGTHTSGLVLQDNGYRQLCVAIGVLCLLVIVLSYKVLQS